MSEPWSPKRLARAKELYLDGATCGQIACELSTTRNAVIGIVHRGKWNYLPGRKVKIKASPRVGTPPRVGTQRRQGSPAFSLRPNGIRSRAIAPEPLPEEPLPIDDLLPLAEFYTTEGCRWIHGEPAYNAPTCGRPQADGSSYCRAHHVRSWRPSRKS